MKYGAVQRAEGSDGAAAMAAGAKGIVIMQLKSCSQMACAGPSKGLASSADQDAAGGLSLGPSPAYGRTGCMPAHGPRARAPAAP